MSPFFERYRDEYIDNLFRISTEGRWEDWIDFCLTGTIEQTEDSIRRCAALNTLREDMRGRVTSGSARLHQVVDELFVRPIVTVPDLRDLLEVTYPTARSDVDRLVEASILTEIEGSSNPRAYEAREIVSIAYRDAPG